VTELNPTAASLLGFLHHGAMTGWDLARTVEGSIGYFWNVTRSQVYRELGRLEASGLVAMGATGARDKRPFSITAEGRAAFTAWIRRDPGPELIRFPLLLTLFFGEFLDPRDVGRFLAAHRAEHERRLAEYREFLAALAESDPYAVATVRFGVAYEEAVLAWFDSLPWLADHRREAARSASPARKPKRRREARVSPKSRAQKTTAHRPRSR
jgi:DNA-binding PadR family transcriptional regulator